MLTSSVMMLAAVAGFHAADLTIEFSRRYTRYSIWSKDQSAFGKLQFVE